MLKLVIIAILVAGGLLSVGYAESGDVKYTVFNHGTGAPYHVWFELMYLFDGTQKTSKRISFDDHDSVTVPNGQYWDINMYKQLENAVGDDGKEVISPPTAIGKPKTALELCYEVTGAFDKAEMLLWRCPTPE